MTSSNSSSILQDVVAYVDVWSSDKRANYSKSFVQQLEGMGAQVSQRFNKQVTHVIFNNGHSATWMNAKKRDVQLVSALWIRRCYDDGVRADEALFPALNDEGNPVMKNRKHRCMLPKDSPERTTGNDWRLKKKLDKMMKDLPPKESLVADMSPIIIDEENGIIYSPALKRSDYMAQRLKDMKDKHENISPTASQITESCELKPSVGSTPTVCKFQYDLSDDDFISSAAELGCSPDKEEENLHLDVGDHDHPKQDSVSPWLSPCHDVPKRPSSWTDCNFDNKEDEEGREASKSRKTSVRKKAAEKVEPGESLLQDRPDRSRISPKVKRKSSIKSAKMLRNKSENKKQEIPAEKSFTDSKFHTTPSAVNSSSSVLSAATIIDAGTEVSEKSPLVKKTLLKTPKQARLSISSLVRSMSLSSGHKGVAVDSSDGDQDVFEDYFSAANNKRPLLPNLPVEINVQVPFDLDCVPKKRKQRCSERFCSGNKKTKLENSHRAKTSHHPSDAAGECLQQQEVKTPALSSSTNVALTTREPRRSCLEFTSTSKTMNDAGKCRPASASGRPPQMEDIPEAELQKNSGFTGLSHTEESGGNDCLVAAGFTEILSEAEENQASLTLHEMVKAKTMRTLVMTSMPSEKQHTVVQVVKALGGFSIVDRVCESTTHVVSGGHKRTLNILLGIARGCWILSFEWILWCLEQRQWIPEEPYELSDQFPAAQICRLQRHLSAGEHQQDLFQNQPAMFVSQHSQPPTQSLVELIELCGGTVCKTVRQAGIFIGKYSGRRPEGCMMLSEQWVLDSITHLKILSFDNYNLE